MTATHREINFSPFATNVLDVVKWPYLCTPDGRKVEVERNGMSFAIIIDGKTITDSADNLGASYILNSNQVGRMVNA